MRVADHSQGTVLRTICLAVGAGLALVLTGCAQDLAKPTAAQMAAGMSRRSPAAKRSVEEIARGAFGTAFRSAAMRGDTAELEFAPNQDGTPDSNYRRIFLLANGAAPAVFRDEPAAQKVRFTAVDSGSPARRLVVFTVSRSTSKKVDWMHGARDHIGDIYSVEYADPKFKALAGSRSG